MVEGADAAVLQSEAGGHRWQRVSPTEKRGRVHTSTVTVAVLPVTDQAYTIHDRDIEVRTTKDSGPGGQHRNKTESCVVMRHRPTGIEAKAATKHQHRNRQLARTLLEGRVRQFYDAQQTQQTNRNRQAQIGSGMRGDKIRTYRVRDNIVIDHATGTKQRLDYVLQGNLCHG